MTDTQASGLIVSGTRIALPEALGRLLRERPARRLGEQCEMCSEVITNEHAHVVDIAGRSIMCCCRACGLLFTDAGAANGRYRTVPDRWLHDPSLALRPEDWDQFAIPVRVAFFFRNSVQGRIVALYPGPGGATESELPLDAWERVLARTLLGRLLAPDVEALIVDRDGRDAGAISCHLVPIDACYELVGRLRMSWVGFDGGTEAHEEIERFFAALRDRSRAAIDDGAA
ncbi:MAG TPA: DUF5947 family protein [Mycobacteriales bacterium]|nr:DUF5947 family protein [Mycobacteriales bacterium]